MPFIVECPYCKLRARAPDRAVGSSGTCQRCANSFTLVPADDQGAPDVVEVSSGASVPAKPSAKETTSTAIAKAVSAVDAKSEAVFAAPRHAAGARFASAGGAAALLSAGLATVCAAVSNLCGLVIPLCVFGFLAGATAIALMCRTPPSARWSLPIIGGLASTAMIIIAIAFPSLLGPTYQYSRQRVASAPARLRAVPIAAGASLSSETPEWIDASKYAVQWGDLRVQVVGVSLGTGPGKEASKGKPAKDEPLILRLRFQKTSRFAWKENARPTLTDATGMSLTLRNRELKAPNEKDPQATQAAMFDEVVTFQAPPKGWESLRLEVPAEAWGAPASFRFVLSPKMLPNPAPGGTPTPKTAK